MHCVKNRKYLRYFKRNPRNTVNNWANIYTQKKHNNMHCTINRKYLRYFERNPRNIGNICANIYGIFNGFERGLLPSQKLIILPQLEIPPKINNLTPNSSLPPIKMLAPEIDNNTPKN